MSGLEVVGVISSIVQIADLGARVALKLCTFCYKVKQAESSIQNLSKDVSFTCTILQQLADNLKQDDQIQLYSQNAFKTAQEILDECGRVFQGIESAMDKELSTFASTEVKNPFLKLSRKVNIVFKEPQLDVLQTYLDRLKNTMLLMMNVIVYASQLRKRETETSKADQKELIEILVQQRRESDQKFERLTRAIQGIELGEFSASVKNTVTINSVGVFDNTLAIGSSVNNESDSPSARLEGLFSLSQVKDDQSIQLSLEIERYSRLIRDILERIQVTESLLTTGRHKRIKQTILDVHAAELQMFNTEYGETAGKLCAQFCQGPLFDHISDQIPEEISEHILAATIEVAVANEELGIGRSKKKKDKKNKKKVKMKAEKWLEAEPENDPLRDDIPIVEQEMSKVIISPLDPTSQDELFDLKNLLSSWTTLRTDEIMI